MSKKVREAGTETYSPNTQVPLLPTMNEITGAIILSCVDIGAFTQMQMSYL